MSNFRKAQAFPRPLKLLDPYPGHGSAMAKRAGSHRPHPASLFSCSRAFRAARPWVSSFSHRGASKSSDQYPESHRVVLRGPRSWVSPVTRLRKGRSFFSRCASLGEVAYLRRVMCSFAVSLVGVDRGQEDSSSNSQPRCRFTQGVTWERGRGGSGERSRFPTASRMPSMPCPRTGAGSSLAVPRVVHLDTTPYGRRFTASIKPRMSKSEEALALTPAHVRN
jgi:hypothetical protein